MWVDAARTAQRWGRRFISQTDGSSGARTTGNQSVKRHTGKSILEPGILSLRTHETERDSKQLSAWFSTSYRGLLRVSETRAIFREDVRFEVQRPGALPTHMTLRTAAERGGRGADGIFKTHAGAVEFLFTRDRDSAACAVKTMYK